MVALDYSRYESVSAVLIKGKTVQMRFYSYEAPIAYAVMAPLRKDGKIVGAVGLLFDGAELRTRGVTEQEFLAMKLKLK